MGFTSGDTDATGLSPAQRTHILGMCTDLNILHWTIAQITNPGHQHTQLGDTPHIPQTTTYTFSQPLPNLDEAPALPAEAPPGHFNTTRTVTPPVPIPSIPKSVPEEWVYTDGSYIKGRPRLGAAVVHIPTGTTIVIDAT
jgi:hypothetical protein